MASRVDIQRGKIQKLREKEKEQQDKLTKIQTEVKKELEILEGMEKDQIGVFMKESGMTGEEVIAFLKRLKEGESSYEETSY